MLSSPPPPFFCADMHKILLFFLFFFLHTCDELVIIAKEKKTRAPSTSTSTLTHAAASGQSYIRTHTKKDQRGSSTRSLSINASNRNIGSFLVVISSLTSLPRFSFSLFCLFPRVNPSHAIPSHPLGHLSALYLHHWSGDCDHTHIDATRRTSTHIFFSPLLHCYCNAHQAYSRLPADWIPLTLSFHTLLLHNRQIERPCQY